MNLAPKSLYSRFLLIIVLPIIILQLITTYIFYQRHWDNVSERMKFSLIGNFTAIISLVNDNELKQAENLAKLFEISIAFLKDEDMESQVQYPLYTDRDLKDFAKKTRKQIQYNSETFYINNRADIAVYFQLPKGTLHFVFSNKKIQSPTTFIFLSWVVGSATLLLLIAIVFMKNQVRSILNLASAAERLGKGLERINFKPSGATEVKKAGWAFLRMQRRIQRQIKHRTELLSHISHDLRTPLTRVKLAVAMLKDNKSSIEISKDVIEMEKLIESYLNFAKEEGNEESQLMNVVEILRQIDISTSDKKLQLKINTPLIFLYIKPQAFKRAITNLINNGLKHCKSKVIIQIKKYEHHLQISVSDDGKGIPKKYWKSVFNPFFKMHPDSEGFGLGLAIVKTIVYNHGGYIKLAKSQLGGLRVIIKLPL
jgi:two-component system, OmpR family, osmolarity sensor histidine kinase EnvZ